MKSKFMPWVDRLPEVGEPILKARDKLSQALARADELEKQAASLRLAIHKEHGELIARIRANWSDADITQSGHGAGGSAFHDVALQDAALSPLVVLKAFKAHRVIQQQNLSSTATHEEQQATLSRVLDWWNYAAVPLLTRLEEEG